MKKNFILGALLMVASFPFNDNLTGRWQTQPSKDGHVTGVVFKSDQTFDGYVDKKPFTSGNYTFKDSVLAFTDTGCEGKEGKYKVIFFSNNDSLRFIPIADSCEGRKNGMSRLVMGRVKK